MIDTITDQIVQQLNELPIVKKKAILELIKENSSSIKKYNNDSLKTWRKNLLSTSVWTDSEINEIFKAREYINKWKPKQFF